MRFGVASLDREPLFAAQTVLHPFAGDGSFAQLRTGNRMLDTLLTIFGKRDPWPNKY
jgi:hypothetical protein